jgi:hypothetical protein
MVSKTTGNSAAFFMTLTPLPGFRIAAIHDVTFFLLWCSDENSTFVIEDFGVHRSDIHSGGNWLETFLLPLQPTTTWRTANSEHESMPAERSSQGPGPSIHQRPRSFCRVPEAALWEWAFLICHAGD